MEENSAHWLAVREAARRLLVETDLKCPVLQIEIGRFVDFGKSSLVVLHSHKIGIFGFHFQDSSGDSGHLSLQHEISIGSKGGVIS